MELTAARRATPLTSKKVKRLREALQEKKRNLGNFFATGKCFFALSKPELKMIVL